MFPELRESADLHGDWFPRLEDGLLHLAEHDERLLASLTDEWLITWDLNTRISEKHGGERLLWTYGGLVAFWRLRQWAAHGVVAREVRANDDSAERLECELTFFRRTERTRALVSNGLEGVGDAPPIYVGGCRINDPTVPWVRVADESGWRITAHMQ